MSNSTGKDGLYFTQTKLKLLAKTGKATPDADGYYELVIGGLNVHNNSGSWFYTAQGVKELFGPGSLLNRKIANGCLRAEVNHPTQRDGESYDNFIARMMDIDLNNVCAHFKEVWLDENFGKNHPEYKNPDLMAIMGKVKPIEPKGSILRSALENIHENVCFSVRSLAQQSYEQGKVVRRLAEVVTFDFVNEGGVLVASKWDSPATESADNVTKVLTQSPVTQRSLERIVQKGKTAAFALESTATADYLLQKHFAKPTESIFKKW